MILSATAAVTGKSVDMLLSPNGDEESTARDQPEATIDDANAGEAEHGNGVTDEILNEYHELARTVLNRSDNTVQLHTRYTERLLDHVGKPPSRITQDEIAAQLDTEDNVSDATRLNIIGALRMFFRDFLNGDVADAFEMPSKSANPRRCRRTTTSRRSTTRCRIRSTGRRFCSRRPQDSGRANCVS